MRLHKQQDHGVAARHAHDVVLEALVSRASSGRVLDVPCGGGSLSRRIRAAGYRVLGLDFEPPDVCEEGLEFGHVDLNDGISLPSRSIDCAISVEGIEHLENPFQFVRELSRVLTDDGILIITTPNISSLRSRWKWLLKGFHYKAEYALDENAPSTYHHINMLSYHNLRYILHTSGFQVEELTTNRIKPVNWLYLPLAPVQYLVTRIGLAMARDLQANRQLSREVLRRMMTLPALFGELMILVARKCRPS